MKHAAESQADTGGYQFTISCEYSENLVYGAILGPSDRLERQNLLEKPCEKYLLKDEILSGFRIFSNRR